MSDTSTEVSTNLTPQQKFEDNIKNRLKDSIGDLVPDEVLEGMVKKAINDAFFSPKTSTGEYGRTTIQESFLERQVKGLLVEKMNTSIQTYFQENEANIQKQVTKIIVENGPALLGQLVVSLLQTGMSKTGDTLFQTIQYQLTQKRF